MKPRHGIALALLSTLAFGPAMYSFVVHRGIEGYYLNDEVCGCGHESFSEVRGDGVYDLLPGHRSRRLFPTVVQTPDGWALTTVKKGIKADLRLIDGAPCWIDRSTGVAEPLRRVRNLWRIWIPWWISTDSRGKNG